MWEEWALFSILRKYLRITLNNKGEVVDRNQKEEVGFLFFIFFLLSQNLLLAKIFQNWLEFNLKWYEWYYCTKVHVGTRYSNYSSWNKTKLVTLNILTKTTFLHGLEEEIFRAHRGGSSQGPWRGNDSTIILIPQHVTGCLSLSYEGNFFSTAYSQPHNRVMAKFV